MSGMVRRSGPICVVMSGPTMPRTFCSAPSWTCGATHSVTTPGRAWVAWVFTIEQHPAAAVTQARVGIEQVGAAVQSHNGLARTRTAVDDEGAA